MAREIARRTPPTIPGRAAGITTCADTCAGSGAIVGLREAGLRGRVYVEGFAFGEEGVEAVGANGDGLPGGHGKACLEGMGAEVPGIEIELGLLWRRRRGGVRGSVSLRSHFRMPAPPFSPGSGGGPQGCGDGRFRNESPSGQKTGDIQGVLGGPAHGAGHLLAHLAHRVLDAPGVDVAVLDVGERLFALRGREIPGEQQPILRPCRGPLEIGGRLAEAVVGDEQHEHVVHTEVADEGAADLEPVISREKFGAVIFNLDEETPSGLAALPNDYGKAPGAGIIPYWPCLQQDWESLNRPLPHYSLKVKRTHTW